jgi:hydroxyethylthiazole kinase-like uncharacterized protein yjeF
MKAATAEQMRRIDRAAEAEHGILSLILMENAGICAAGVATEMLGGDARRKSVAIVCGKGNNGGDGFVIARHLANSGAIVTLLTTGDAGSFKGDAKTNYDILTKWPPLRAPEDLKDADIGELARTGTLNLTLHHVANDKIALEFTAPALLSTTDLVIDALFGTGLDSSIAGIYVDLIKTINVCGKPVLSVDIPSGINSDTGEVMGVAVRADKTVSFGLPKIGMLIGEGAEHSGDVIVADISLPRAYLSDPGLPYNYLTKDEVAKIIPPRAPDSHKGTFGKVLTVAGSVGMTGAGAMASESALKIGAGLSYYALPEGLNIAMEAALTEVITRPLPETDSGSLSLDGFDKIIEYAEECDVVALGPGVSPNSETTKLVSKLCSEITKPLVIDADGLLAAGLGELHSDKRPATIITPHPGEMARLLDTSIEEVQSNRLKTAEEAAKRFGCIVVLKGYRTLIADPGGQVYANLTGNPGMATAGSGDVLTGSIAGLMAQGVDPLQAAAAGAFIHGLAGDLAAGKVGEASLMAGDILRFLPAAIQEIQAGETG